MNANLPKQDPSNKEAASTPFAKKLRVVLFLAFAALLLLMLAAGLSALSRLRQLHDIEQQVSNRFLSHTQALSTIVISVDIYDDQLARFLLEQGSEGRAQKGSEIASHAERAHSALRRYPPDRGPREQQLLQEIEKELSEQETASSTFLSLSPQDRKGRSLQFVHQQLLPLSLSILQVSQEIASVNNEQLAQGNRDLSIKLKSLQTNVRNMLLLALSAGLSLSAIGSFYIVKLERQDRNRYCALEDSRRELEKLSARLVDVQEEERRSIARELHDEVGQTLEALLVGLGGLSRLVPATNSTARDQIDRVKSLAENSIKTVRDIALLLRPSMLDDLGLIPALEWQVREVSRRGEVEAEVHAEMPSEDLPDEVKVCVYRLVQEALNNAAAHASAKNARVVVMRSADKLSVTVTDNGRGFDSQRVRGMGLLGMEERVKRLGGILKVQSQAGHGTSVIAELPLHD